MEKKLCEGDLVRCFDNNETWEIDHFIDFPDDSERVYECFNVNDDTRELFCFYESEIEKI